MLTALAVTNVAGGLVLTKYEDIVRVDGEKNLALSGEVDVAVRGAGLKAETDMIHAALGETMAQTLKLWNQSCQLFKNVTLTESFIE
jgi:hypothetical protein